jgi:uncharacterized protein YukE
MRGIKKLLAGVLLLGLLAFPFLVYFNAQALTDWWQLRGYSPPTAVSDLATQDSMSAFSRHVFYVNHPNIESDTGQFRKDCGETEKTIILGCYHSNQDGIFVYNVQDSRLAGIQQVTSAHEMLHAAYDRLNSKDKKYVNGLLTDFFNNGLKDQRIKDTINIYRETEPNDIVDEMHSIFGTEVASLPAPLEQYYSKYFKDRSAVTKDAAAYEGEFTGRESQIKLDDSKLSGMKSAIDSGEQSLQTQLVQINKDRARLDSLRAGGRIAEYNSGVSSFNREVNAYNNGIAELRADITAFNQLVDERNSIATELASLNQAIDTRQAPETIQ